MESKPTNPKDAIGDTKASFSYVPAIVGAFAAMSFMEGATKYGAFNWRHAGVRSSVYTNAMQRHLLMYLNGEDVDPATQVPHLASIIACAGIIADADLHDMLTDDRVLQSEQSRQLNLRVAEVQAHLKELHSHLSPRHYLRGVPAPNGGGGSGLL